MRNILLLLHILSIYIKNIVYKIVFFSTQNAFRDLLGGLGSGESDFGIPSAPPSTQPPFGTGPSLLPTANNVVGGSAGIYESDLQDLFGGGSADLPLSNPMSAQPPVPAQLGLQSFDLSTFSAVGIPGFSTLT